MDYYWQGNLLKNELLNIKDAKKLIIATAYFSLYGLDILKEIISTNKLSRKQITIYLSPEFTSNNPGHLLEETQKIAVTYIVSKIPFHSKMVYVENNQYINLIFGSSNFTKGGIEKNIEFDTIWKIPLATEEKELIDTLNKVKMFFDFIRSNSILVNEEIIKSYHDIKSKLDDILKTQKNIRKNLFSFLVKEDSFDEDEYGLENYYFNFQDYEVFFLRNVGRNDGQILKQRKDIQLKMIAIHQKIYSRIKKLNLYCHWRPENITSLIKPAVYNKYKVEWLGVRYGKDKSELDILNKGALKDQELGFQKHACLQFSIFSDGFDINLFHAVSNDAYDRKVVHDKLGNNNFKMELIKQLKKLQGEGLVWHIYDDQNKIPDFILDNEEPNDFLEYYKKYDMDGRESFLTYYVEPDDPRMKDINTIAELIVKKIKLLLPLYGVLVQRLK